MSWRDHLKIHPAAELFPLMSEPELRELGEDIKANGLLSSIVLYEGKLLDGRNRLDAMESVGIKFRIEEDKYKLRRLRACDSSGNSKGLADLVHSCNGDPYEFVLSANLHRRHLTSEQKRELIEKVLKAKPEASNATVAKQVKADDKTVAKVRHKLESTSEIPKLEKTVGADGKSRAKPKRKSESKPIDPTLPAISRGAMGDACVVAALEAESRAKKKAPELVSVTDPDVTESPKRATASPEISVEQRRAENARLDEPAETAVDEIDRRVNCVTNTILRHVEDLSRSDAERFFAVLRDQLDEAEREVLRDAEAAE